MTHKPQNTVRRILTLIDYLQERRTLQEMVERLEVDKRTIYRYLNILNLSGKPVNTDGKGWILNEVKHYLPDDLRGVPMIINGYRTRKEWKIKDHPVLW